MRVLVFARAPVPGRCKTRLIPHLGARGAAWVQRRLTEQALATAIATVGAGAVTLYGAPDVGHAFCARCRQRFGVRLARQGPGDLGCKMRRALATGPALLIGSDAYELRADDLRRAWAALAGHDFRPCDYVLIPALDGGYGLIGARRPLPSLAGVAWSSGRELAQTGRRLRRIGIARELLPARADFDSAPDWRRARRAGRLPPLVRGK